MVKTFICPLIYYLLMVNACIQSAICSNLFSKENVFTNKILSDGYEEDYMTSSIGMCALQCGTDCWCFGYQAATSNCRTLRSCHDKNSVGPEDGWVYYKPTDCDEGWTKYNGHCYIRNTTALSQPEAMSACQQFGAYLLEVDDVKENHWVTSTLLKDVYCINEYFCTTWTGGNDIETEGVFVWGYSGTPVTFTNWDAWNPDDMHNPSEEIDCVEMFYTGQWNDKPCDSATSFICEK